MSSSEMIWRVTGSLYFPESCVYKYQSICDSEATGITGEIP